MPGASSIAAKATTFVYEPDGTHVYFIHRKVSAIVWGLGYEFFTQPAHVYVLQDGSHSNV